MADLHPAFEPPTASDEIPASPSEILAAQLHSLEYAIEQELAFMRGLERNSLQYTRILDVVLAMRDRVEQLGEKVERLTNILAA